MTDEAIIGFVIDRFERGFVNRASDRGGPTSFGITAATLGRARNLGRDATADEVRDMRRGEAAAILLQDYVVGCGYSGLANWRLRVSVIDSGITSGQPYSTRVLQRILNVKTDGICGLATIAAANALAAEAARLATAQHLGDRLRLMGHLIAHNHSQADNAGGWCDRVATLLELVSAV